jgi:hypothetical protein
VHRHLHDIVEIIVRSRLEPTVARRAEELFTRLAEVEGTVHGIAPHDVHFHEVGALDALVDIVGACAAMEYLAPSSVTCGTVVVGSGTARTAHGIVPVPAPATARLLEGIPTRGDGAGELTTPTGALILREFVDSFGPQPEMLPTGSGYGLGRRELEDRANAVRLTQGRPIAGAGRSDLPAVAVIECQVDDFSPEGCGFVLETLLANGALDVYVTPVVMKKGRPGHLYTVLCREADRERLAVRLLRETGSLGCRFSTADRLELQREQRSVETIHGRVSIKVGRLEHELMVAAPEFEDCRRLALERGVAWREVYTAALVAYFAAQPSGAHDTDE